MPAFLQMLLRAFASPQRPAEYRQSLGNPLAPWQGDGRLCHTGSSIGGCMNVKRAIDLTEKAFLVLIALFTVAAMVQEVLLLVDQRRVELKDLLLMFIYAEVLGMLGAFYSSHRIPITIPLFIAMTALSRLIILQGKEGDPTILLYESGAILMIAIACWVVSKLNPRNQDD
jgi:protein PsiE